MRRFGAIPSSEQAESTVWKTTETQVVNNSTTLVDDDTLIMALETSSVYRYVFELWWSTDSTADFKFAPAYTSTHSLYYINEFVVPAGTTMIREEVKTANSTETADGSSGTHGYLRLIGVISTTGAGNLKIQWAQGTATAIDTKVLKGSRLTAIKIA